jgi:pyroglutamyl-peptidase
MTKPALLVTGFGPFPGVPVNPSERLARRVASLPRLRRSLGAQPCLLVLRTAYEAIPAQLEPALREAPAAILMFGVAKRARRVRVEVRARNRASRLFPDASGHVARRLTLEAGGPDERRCREAEKMLAGLRRSGLRVVRSQDAGRYLCNAAYFRALREEIPVVFLHIPPLPDPNRPGRPGLRRRRTALDALAEAAATAALLLTRRGTRRR